MKARSDPEGQVLWYLLTFQTETAPRVSENDEVQVKGAANGRSVEEGFRLLQASGSLHKLGANHANKRWQYFDVISGDQQQSIEDNMTNDTLNNLFTTMVCLL